MSPLLVFLSAALLASTTPSQETELTLETKQGFALKADYFKPQNTTKRAVLLLHQCNFNRTMYDDVGLELSLRGIHALSLDFRWMGESIDGKTDIKELAKLPPEERQNPWAMIMEHWPEDVRLAYDFLRQKIGEDGLIGVTGASCGGRQASILAENNPVSALSFFSSAAVDPDDTEDIAYYKTNLSNIPTLFISAEQDATYSGTQAGFSLNQNLNTKLVSYKGNHHGYPLLEQDKHLAKSIATWFDDVLVKSSIK